MSHWQVTYLCDTPECRERHVERVEGICRQDARDFFRLAHPSYTILDIEPSAAMS
jgi:hypothetical protein